MSNLQSEDVGMMKQGHEDRHGDWMETASGKKFFPLDPRPEDFDMQDIAHHLARINRYNGATKLECYSVAEHSVHMARWVHSTYGCRGYPELSYQALMHDAPEAYVGDIIRPLKRQPELKAFCHAEELVWEALVDWSPVLTSYELDDRVKEADNRILVDERAQVMRPSTNSWGIDHLEALGIQIEGWGANRAMAEFLTLETRYRRLSTGT